MGTVQRTGSRFCIPVQWEQFKELEADFVSQYSVEVWQEVFNFRLKLALDKDSDRWLLMLRAVATFSSPNPLNIIGIESRITTNQNKGMIHRLCHQNTIKRISMM